MFLNLESIWPKTGPDSVSEVNSISLPSWTPPETHHDQHPTASLSAYTLQTFQSTLDISGLFTYIHNTYGYYYFLLFVHFL